MEEILQIREKLNSLGDKKQAETIKKYLKSPYEFYGIKVPQLRSVAKQYKNLSLYDTFNLFDELWNSKNHEEMSLALFLLENHKKNYNLEMWKFLKPRLEKAKTWDHIDQLSSHTVGEILSQNFQALYPEMKELSNARNPWMRRLSIVSTYPLIKLNKIEPTLKFAEKLVYDSDVYVQKGAGWMIREAGKRDRLSVREFILMHKKMKRAALSYSTEKMTELRIIIKREEKENKLKIKPTVEK